MRNIFFVFLVVACVGCGGCRRRQVVVQHAEQQRDRGYRTVEGLALGTTYRVVVGRADTAGLTRILDSLFTTVERSLSIYDHNSLISRVNDGLTDSIDVHLWATLSAALEVSRLSGGMYDVTVKPLTDALGFGETQERKPQNINHLLKYVGYKKIELDPVARKIKKADPRVQIDLNSVAKGYAVDLVFRELAGCGIDNLMIEIGGEIRCMGLSPRGTPWRVGIDRPEEGNMIPGQKIATTVLLGEDAMATSGNYRRYYTAPGGQKVVHTINPLTGASTPNNLLSATVIYADATRADALATMCMALGFEGARAKLNEANIAGYLIYSDSQGGYRTWMTEAFWNYLEHKSVGSQADSEDSEGEMADLASYLAAVSANFAAVSKNKK